METLEHIRTRLQQRRRELLQHVGRLHDGQQELDADFEHEEEERAQEENIARLIASLDDRERAELQAIDRALGRIEAGSYGLCEVCGRTIPRARLEALPFATTCLEHAAQREQQTAL